MYAAEVIGTGIELGSRVIGNHELEQSLGLAEGYILRTTGIKKRRWTANDQDVVSLAVGASTAGVENAGVGRLDAIVICRDVILTDRALSIGLPIIRRLAELGVDVGRCYTVDFANYCPGFVYGLDWARMKVALGECETVMVVAATDYGDLIIPRLGFGQRKLSLPEGDFPWQPPELNAFLWGCGAAAMVVGWAESGAICGYEAHSSRRHMQEAFAIGEDNDGHGFARLDGPAIFRFAVGEVADFLTGYLERQGLTWADVDYLLPHQPNPRTLQVLARRLGLPWEKVLVSCDTLGNLIAAAVPVTYHLAKVEGKIKPGTRTLVCSFGDAHLTIAACLLTEGV